MRQNCQFLGTDTAQAAGDSISSLLSFKNLTSTIARQICQWIKILVKFCLVKLKKEWALSRKSNSTRHNYYLGHRYKKNQFRDALACSKEIAKIKDHKKYYTKFPMSKSDSGQSEKQEESFSSWDVMISQTCKRAQWDDAISDELSIKFTVLKFSGML